MRFYKNRHLYNDSYQAIDAIASHIVMTPGSAIEAWKTDDRSGITIHSSTPQKPGQRPTASFCPLIAGGVCYHQTSYDAFAYVVAAFDHDPKNLYEILHKLLANSHRHGLLTFT